MWSEKWANLTESYHGNLYSRICQKQNMWKWISLDIKVVREFSPKYFMTDQVERNFLGKEKNEEIWHKSTRKLQQQNMVETKYFERKFCLSEFKVVRKFLWNKELTNLTENYLNEFYCRKKWRLSENFCEMKNECIWQKIIEKISTTEFCKNKICGKKD